MVCMLLGNLLVSVTYSNQLIDNLLAYTLTYTFYFGTLIIGIIYAVFGVKIYNNVVLGLEPHYVEKRFSGRFIKTKKRLKKIMIVISRATFIIGFIFGIGILFGSFEVVTTFIAIISGQFGHWAMPVAKEKERVSISDLLPVDYKWTDKVTGTQQGQLVKAKVYKANNPGKVKPS